MTFFLWSRTGTTNASADPTVNYAEGQAPSSLNDSARNAMAALAKYRDDISGAIVTGGTSTAYTLTSFQQFDTLAHMNGQTIAFTPHATNTGTCTINTDSLGAKPLRSAPNVEIPSGTIIQGTPYLALYNNTDGAWYLKGFYGSPYSIPIASTIDYWAPTAPNSSFVFPFGQAISRTTYSTLFSLISTTFGTGDGSTTFNLPDLRGRAIASPDNMGGGTDPNRLTNGALAGVRNSIGGAGGESGHTLVLSEIPSHSHAVTDPGHTHTIQNQFVSGTFVNAVGGNFAHQATVTTDSATTGISIQNNGGGASHNIMQPTILCNRIMRII
jgi:microcystin-dependent protein